jgi:hypothetical protein
VGVLIVYPNNVPFWAMLVLIFVVVYGSYKYPNKEYFDRKWPTLSPTSIDWFERHGGSKIWQITIFIFIVIFFVLNFISFLK